MASHFRGPRRYDICMLEISKDDEERLDRRESFGIEIGDRVFAVGPTNVKYYGEIDFNSGTEDYALLEESRLFFPMEFQGASVPANYDYEKHVCYSDKGRASWFDTVNAALICQYAHGILNKPKRVAIVEVCSI